MTLESHHRLRSGPISLRASRMSKDSTPDPEFSARQGSRGESHLRTDAAGVTIDKIEPELDGESV